METELDLIRSYEGVKMILSISERKPQFLYAKLVNGKGETLVSADVDYCVMRLNQIAELRRKHGLFGDF